MSDLLKTLKSDLDALRGTGDSASILWVAGRIFAHADWLERKLREAGKL